MIGDWTIYFTPADGRSAATIANADLTIRGGALIFSVSDPDGAGFTGRVDPLDLVQTIIRTGPAATSARHSMDFWWRTGTLGALLGTATERIAATGVDKLPDDDAGTWMLLYDDLGPLRVFRATALRLAKLV